MEIDDRLSRILPVPEHPVEVPDPGRWNEVERAVGISLPPDYKAFVSTYGTGSIDDFLMVLNPFSDRPALRLQDFGEKMLGVLRETRAEGVDPPPYPIHPEPDGLLPWGATDNGDWCYWVASPTDDAARWRIAVNMSRGPDWFDHPGPLTAFLADLLSRAVRVPFLPEEFPSSPVAFRQFRR